jgi:hypothetical protein
LPAPAFYLFFYFFAIRLPLTAYYLPLTAYRLPLSAYRLLLFIFFSIFILNPVFLAVSTVLKNNITQLL